MVLDDTVFKYQEISLNGKFNENKFSNVHPLVDLDLDLSQKPIDAAHGGRHPLPDIKNFAALAVKKLNPAGVNVAPSIFWDVEGSLKNTVIDSSNVNQQVVIVENGVNYSAKRYNDLKVINDRLTFDLKNGDCARLYPPYWRTSACPGFAAE